MKMTVLPSALYIALFVVAVSATVRAQNAQKSAVSERELQAKIEYCKTCHGLSGQGYCGSIPMPRLAGQPSEYLEDQLRAFVERKRTNSFMSKVADALSPPMQKAIASHFNGLDQPHSFLPPRTERSSAGIPRSGLPRPPSVPPRSLRLTTRTHPSWGAEQSTKGSPLPIPAELPGFT